MTFEIAIENIIAASITLFALLLLLVSLRSYMRSKRPKILLICVAFGLFFIKGLALTLGLFLYYSDLQTTLIVTGILDVIVLLLFFVGTSSRKPKPVENIEK
jgi:hypothetical protein